MTNLPDLEVGQNNNGIKVYERLCLALLSNFVELY